MQITETQPHKASKAESECKDSDHSVCLTIFTWQKLPHIGISRFAGNFSPGTHFLNPVFKVGCSPNTRQSEKLLKLDEVRENCTEALSARVRFREL
jgi:hypothetical protein